MHQCDLRICKTRAAAWGILALGRIGTQATKFTGHRQSPPENCETAAQKAHDQDSSADCDDHNLGCVVGRMQAAGGSVFEFTGMPFDLLTSNLRQNGKPRLT